MSRIKHGALHVGDVGQMATIIFISKPLVSARSQSACCPSVNTDTVLLGSRQLWGQPRSEATPKMKSLVGNGGSRKRLPETKQSLTHPRSGRTIPGREA